MLSSLRRYTLQSINQPYKQRPSAVAAVASLRSLFWCANPARWQAPRGKLSHLVRFPRDFRLYVEERVGVFRPCSVEPRRQQSEKRRVALCHRALLLQATLFPECWLVGCFSAFCGSVALPSLGSCDHTVHVIIKKIIQKINPKIDTES